MQCEDTGEPVVQLQNPVIEHTPSTASIASGDSMVLEALATDEDGVRLVTVYHRTTGSTYWDSSPLEEIDGVWTAELTDLKHQGWSTILRRLTMVNRSPHRICQKVRLLNPIPWKCWPHRLICLVEDFELEEGDRRYSRWMVDASRWLHWLCMGVDLFRRTWREKPVPFMNRVARSGRTVRLVDQSGAQLCQFGQHHGALDGGREFSRFHEDMDCLSPPVQAPRMEILLRLMTTFQRPIRVVPVRQLRSQSMVR